MANQNAFTSNTFARGNEAFVVARDAADLAGQAENKAQQAIDLITAGGEGADGLITTYFVPNAPTDASNGDLWFDTDDGNKLYRYNGAYGSIPRTNRAYLPSANYGLTNLVSLRGNLSTDSTVTHEGRYSWRSVVNAVDLTGNLEQHIRYESTAPAAAGQYWTMSAYMRSSLGSGITKFRPRIVWLNGSNVVMGDAYGDIVTTADANSWVRVSLTALAPTGTTKFSFLAGPTESSEIQVSDAYWMADMLFEVGSTLNSYFDGGMPYAAWSGPTGNSASTFTPGWQLAADQHIADALTAAAGAQATADGKIRTFLTPTAPVIAIGTNVGDLWMDTDDGNRLYRWDGDSWEPVGDTRIDDAVTVANQAINAANGKAKVIYSTGTPGTVNPNNAGDLWFQYAGDGGNIVGQWIGLGGTAWQQQVLQDAVLGSLTVGKLVTGVLAAGVKVIAGNPAGSYAQMADTGFAAYAAAEDGESPPRKTINLGSTDVGDTFSLTNAQGDVVIGMSDTGRVSFPVYASIGSDGPEYSYDPDSGENILSSGLEIYGTEFTEWNSRRGAGDTLAQAYYSAPYISPRISTEMGLCELSFTAERGKSYITVFNGVNWQWEDAACTAVFAIRQATGGAAPTITSQLLDTTSELNASSDGYVLSSKPMNIQLAYNGADTTLVRLLLTVRKGYGSSAGSIRWRVDDGSVAPRKHMRWYVTDAGSDVTETYIGNGGGGVYATPPDSSPTPPSPPTPTTPKITRIKTYTSTSSGSYRSSGVKRTDNGGTIYQGQSFSGSINGNQRGLWILPYSTIQADLAGSVVNKVEVYLYANHWWYNSGGTALIRSHTYTSLPGSSPSYGLSYSVPGWPKPGGKWVNMPSTWLDGWRTGSIRGIGIGPAPSTSQTYYGGFNPTMQVRITSTK